MIGSWPPQRVAAGMMVTSGLLGLVVMPLLCHAEERYLSPEALAGYSVRYLQHPKEPGTRDSVFWAIGLVSPGAKGIGRYVTVKAGGGYVLLLFTSPLRSFLYAESAPDIPGSVKIVPWSPDRCFDRLHEIRRDSRVELFVLDKAARCPGITAYAIRDQDSVRDLARMWKIWRDVANRIGGKYWPQALAAAEKGDFPRSLDLVEQLVQCVIPEEPRLYVLIGAAGIAQGNQTLVDSAVSALQLLEPATAARLASEATGASRSSEKERRAAAARVVRMVKGVRGTILPK